MSNPFFEVLPADARLPCSPNRVVQWMRSSNFGGLAGAAQGSFRAHLLVVFTLRGSYLLFVYLESRTGSAGPLLGGKRAEASVAQFSALEAQALQWLRESGFQMENIELALADWQERARALSFLPFSHRDSGSATQGTQAAEPVEGKAGANVLGLLGENPPKAVKNLRDFLISG